MQFTITPETEIYTNAERKNFVMVDFIENDMVYYRKFNRGEVPLGLDFSRAASAPALQFAECLRVENAVLVGVEELTWVPAAAGACSE